MRRLMLVSSISILGFSANANAHDLTLSISSSNSKHVTLNYKAKECGMVYWGDGNRALSQRVTNTNLCRASQTYYFTGSYMVQVKHDPDAYGPNWCMAQVTIPGTPGSTIYGTCDAHDFIDSYNHSDITGAGSQTNVFIKDKSGVTYELWGENFQNYRGAVDVQVTADAYCDKLGYVYAASFEAQACGEDELAYYHYDKNSNKWVVLGSGSKNRCYQLISRVSCSN